MTISGVEIGRAAERDLDGILELQAANQPERGGLLSAELPRSRVAAMMRAMPLIVARRNGRIVAFLMNSPREMNDDVPIIRAMLDAYPGSPDAYVYGPICVSEEERGKGLAQEMVAELRQLEPGREVRKPPREGWASAARCRPCDVQARGRSRDRGRFLWRLR